MRQQCFGRTLICACRCHGKRQHRTAHRMAFQSACSRREGCCQVCDEGRLRGKRRGGVHYGRRRDPVHGFHQRLCVNINQVLITGLAEGTEYVYVAGDGVTWSELKTSRPLYSAPIRTSLSSAIRRRPRVKRRALSFRGCILQCDHQQRHRLRFCPADR